MLHRKNQKAFTLLEILLVVGIIAILAGIVIIAINPANSLARTRDLQRKIGIAEINKALTQYYIDKGQYPPSLGSTTVKGICVTGTATSGVDCTNQVDLSPLVPNYLAAIPTDPTGVGYQIGLNSSSHVMIIANLTETVSPLIAIGTTTYAVIADTNPNITLGDGSVGNPFQVDNWSQIDQIRNNLSANYILTASLSASTFGYASSGANWVPIGNAGTPFTGNFNGNGNTISGLTINLPAASYVGLFGYATGNISNVGLTNISVSCGSWCGGLVGYNWGLVNNSYTTGTITGLSYTGGLVGFDDRGGSVTNSHSTVTVRGASSASVYIGGLVGYHVGWVSTVGISNSYATGDVITIGHYVGGLVGEIDNGLNNKNYATGVVGGASYVGGLVGYTLYNNATISNSYARGNVTGTDASYYGAIAGGLVGYNDGATITYSYSSGNVTGYEGSMNRVGGFAGGNSANINSTNYWDTQTSGQASSGGNAVGKTTSQMQTPSTYVGWDTASVWNITNGSYPTLK